MPDHERFVAPDVERAFFRTCMRSKPTPPSHPKPQSKNHTNLPNLRSDPTNFRQECFSFSRTPVTLVTPGSAGLVGASMMPALGSGLRPIEARNYSRRMVFNSKF